MNFGVSLFNRVLYLAVIVIFKIIRMVSFHVVFVIALIVVFGRTPWALDINAIYMHYFMQLCCLNVFHFPAAKVALEWVLWVSRGLRLVVSKVVWFIQIVLINSVVNFSRRLAESLVFFSMYIFHMIDIIPLFIPIFVAFIAWVLAFNNFRFSFWFIMNLLHMSLNVANCQESRRPASYQVSFWTPCTSFST